jgi:thiol-disulfide isomerase/thioredoxin
MLGKLRRLVAGLAGAAIIVGVTGCAGTGNVNTSVNGSLGYQDGDSRITIFKTSDRQQAGDVSGTTLQGRPLSLSSYRGKVVVVNFWSSACGPCLYEAQAFAGLAKADASKGVSFVGIDERDNLDAAMNFERSYQISYPSLYDRTDAYLLDFPGAVPASTPTTIILDRNGGIAAKVNGSLDYTHLNILVNHVLNEHA